MALIFKQQVDSYRPWDLPNLETPSYIKCVEFLKDEVAFEHRVLAEYTSNQKIMSDVYADCYYAVVAASGGYRTIYVGSSEGDTVADVIVDAPDAMIKVYQAHLDDIAEAKREAKEKLAEAARQDAARDCMLEITKGCQVKVVKGRKVAIGTTGECFWTGSNQFGPRIGLRTADGATYWTAEGNVVRTDVDELAVEAEKAGGWCALLDAKRTAEYEAIEEYRKTFPVKGTKVQTASGFTGSVFWKSPDGERVGIKTGPNRTDVVWASVTEVAEVTAPAA